MFAPSTLSRSKKTTIEGSVCLLPEKRSLTKLTITANQTTRRNNMTPDKTAREREDAFAFNSSSRSSTDIEICSSAGHETIENRIIDRSSDTEWLHVAYHTTTSVMGAPVFLALPLAFAYLSLDCHELLLGCTTR